tara:strand:- start:1725 stop:2300 length:576 start_codon:yes stop_codon:yes gene_type:complete
MYNNSVKKFANTNTGSALVFICIVSLFVTLISMFCNPNIAKKYPDNYFLLSFFTICNSYVIGFITTQYDTLTVLQAFAVTAAITFALTMYAWQTKYDFTTWGAGLLSCLVAIIIVNILNIWIQNTVLHTIMSCFGAILFSFYIIYDTQLIIGGKHKKYQYDIDDYVFATITLYLDIINLFLYILKLLDDKN